MPDINAAILAYRQESNAYNLAVLLDLILGGIVKDKKLKRAAKNQRRIARINARPFVNSLDAFYSIIEAGFTPTEIGKLQRLSYVARLDTD